MKLSEKTQEIASDVLRAVLGTNDVKPEYRELAERCVSQGFIEGLCAAQVLWSSLKHPQDKERFSDFIADVIALRRAAWPEQSEPTAEDIKGVHKKWPRALDNPYFTKGAKE